MYCRILPGSTGPRILPPAGTPFHFHASSGRAGPIGAMLRGLYGGATTGFGPRGVRAAPRAAISAFIASYVASEVSGFPIANPSASETSPPFSGRHLVEQLLQGLAVGTDDVMEGRAGRDRAPPPGRASASFRAVHASRTCGARRRTSLSARAGTGARPWPRRRPLR